MQLDTVKADDFRPHLNSAFQFNTSEATVTALLLAEVSDLPGDPNRRAPFSLLFRGASGLPQRTYQVRHEQLGEFDLFIVPLKPDAAGPRYEAVFN